MQKNVSALTSAFILLFSIASSGQKQAETHSRDESRFLDSLKKGKSFNAEGKSISAHFIEKLVMNPPQTIAFKVNGILLTRAKIVGDLDLHNATVFFPIDIQHSIFEGKVDMNDIKVNNYSNLIYDTFNASVDLRFSNFSEALYLSNSMFKSILDLSDLTDKEDLSLDSVVSLDTCVLPRAKIGNDLKLTNAVFMADGTTLDLNNCVIGGSVVLNGGQFHPNFEMSGSKIGRNINMDHSIFFDSLNCVSINCGNQFTADQSDFQCLILNLAVVKGLIQIKNSSFNEVLNCSYLLADKSSLELTNDFISTGSLDDMELGRIDLFGSQFTNYLDLSYTKTGKLDLSSVRYPGWSRPGVDSNIDLGGLTYNRLIIGNANDEDSLRKFLTLLDTIPLSQDSYVEFEQYCKNNNFSDLADDVYISYKNREPWGIRHFLLHVLIGYGRVPFRVLIPAVLLIFGGFIVFRDEKKMMLIKPDETNPRYNRYWYSFDLFLPVINLNEAEKWIPQEQYKWMRFYRRLLGILGWLLVPIGLAGISGLIR
jgi:hypothetical protein